jgi:hypothetical protein
VTFHAVKAGSVTFTLRSAGGALLDTASKDTPKAGAYVLRFRSGGVPVNITSGREVIGSFASDARMTLPPLALDIDQAGDQVSGTCFPNGSYRINAGPSATDFDPYQGMAAADGTFSRSVSPLQPGWLVVVTCETQRGDWLVRSDEA